MIRNANQIAFFLNIQLNHNIEVAHAQLKKKKIIIILKVINLMRKKYMKAFMKF